VPGFPVDGAAHYLVKRGHSLAKTLSIETGDNCRTAVVPDLSRIVSIAGFHRADTGIKLIGHAPGADPGLEIRSNAWRQILPLAAAGILTLLPMKTYALTEAAQAHTFLAEGHPNSKLVLIPAR